MGHIEVAISAVLSFPAVWHYTEGHPSSFRWNHLRNPIVAIRNDPKVVPTTAANIISHIAVQMQMELDFRLPSLAGVRCINTHIINHII